MTEPIELQTDDKRDPLGVNPGDLRFSWRLPGSLRQSSFQIIVATATELLSPNDADVWDSGRIEGSDATVAYDGPQLKSRTKYVWTLRIWDGDQPSKWATPATFETSLNENDWTANWICAGLAEKDEAGMDRDEVSPAPYLRNEFALDPDRELSRARVYLAPGGFAELYVNGERVGDQVLDTGHCDYEERVWTATLDVTDLLTTENAIGLVLGRGRYAQTTPDVWNWPEAPWHSNEAHCCCQLELTYNDGEHVIIGTDESWKATDGATRFDSLFEGETYDARQEPIGWTTTGFDDSEWTDAVVVDGPGGKRTPQIVQPMRVVDRFDPVSIEVAGDGRYIVDVGRQVTGWCELAVDAAPGEEITLRYGEYLLDDGSVVVRDLWRMQHDREFIGDNDYQTDRYICAGDAQDGDERETWTPRFSYRGFRYVEIEGYPGEPSLEDLTVEEVYTPVDDDNASAFVADDTLLTTIHTNTRRAMLNNFHSIPTDTPVYEKNGWTGDALATGEAALYNFSMRPFFRKWLADMADAQRANGEVPVIVPTSDWGYPEYDRLSGGTGGDQTPVWDAAYVYLPWWTYRHTGDLRLLERHFDGMTRLVDWHAERADDLIIDSGHGDHCAPLHDRDDFAPEGPAICSTAYLFGMADTVAEIATVLERSAEANRFRTLAAEIAQSFNKHFFDAERAVYRTGDVDEYRQTSNILPLAFDLVPPGEEQRVIEHLVSDIRDTHDGHLNTGVVGTKDIFPILTDHGYVDLAYEIATKTTYPSYGHWIEAGETALLERWELHARSRDHHMFGSVDEWFYRHLAGISPVEPGYETVRVAPKPPTNLTAIDATVDTIRGPVDVSWEQDSGFSLDVSIPANAQGIIGIPGVTEPSDVEYPSDVMHEEAGTFRVGPGSWTFEC